MIFNKFKNIAFRSRIINNLRTCCQATLYNYRPGFCIDELIADLLCGEINVLTITFTAAESGPIVIQGGLTAGTEIIDDPAPESNILELIEDHPSAGGPSNVTRWEGYVEACVEVRITIQFTGGNGIGDWSAKRDGELLAETEEISCPQ